MNITDMRDIEMLQEERLQRIEEYINFRGRASFQELMKELDLSKATIRRDLKRLEAEERLTIVRGGAIAKEPESSRELPYYRKLETNSEEKQRIAKSAAALVESGKTIVLDSGTTTRHMVPHLAQLPYAHIITCDVLIAADCSYYPNIETTVIGGKLRSGYHSLYGYLAEQMIRTLNADIAFLSADAISDDGTCAITNIEEVLIKQYILKCADKSVLLCDHTKFNLKSVVKIYDINDVDLVICGRELAEERACKIAGLTERLSLV